MELPVSIILIIIQVVLGLILLFRGNKSVRLVLGILGFVGGVSIANFLVVYFALEDFWIWLLPLNAWCSRCLAYEYHIKRSLLYGGSSYWLEGS